MEPAGRGVSPGRTRSGERRRRCLALRCRSRSWWEQAPACSIAAVTFVGPDNGLFELVRRRIPDARLTRIDWRPERLSATFHGRDLFAPVAAMIARGDPVPCSDLSLSGDRPGADWPDSLAEVIYVDAYGNLITGLAGSTLQDGQSLRVGSRTMGFARTFWDVPAGSLFWHRNSSGLVEIAANQARAVDLLDIVQGAVVQVV